MAVQGPVVVFGFTAASGSARTSCCISSTAVSGSARTIRMNLAHTGRNTLPILFSAMKIRRVFSLYEGIIGVHFVSVVMNECSMVENVIMYIRANKGSRPLSHMFFRFVNKVIQFFCIKSAD